MKSIREVRLVLIKVSFLLSTSLIAHSQEMKDTLYILFEKNNPNLLKINLLGDQHYAFFMHEKPPQYFYFGFRPKGEGVKILKDEFAKKKELKDLAWLRENGKFNSQVFMKCPNVYIAEEIGKDTLFIVPVNVFEATE